jgi:hypothetical protein
MRNLHIEETWNCSAVNICAESADMAGRQLLIHVTPAGSLDATGAQGLSDSQTLLYATVVAEPVKRLAMRQA